MGVGVRVIAGERTGYAYSDDLSPEKIRKAANVAAHIAAAPAKVEKFDLNEGRKHNLYPVLMAPTETAFTRTRGPGEARRPRRAGLRPAHLSGAGGLRRQSAPGAGGHQRRQALGGPAAPGAAQRVGAGAAERRPPAARPRGRRRTHGPGLFPEGKDARALRPRSGARSHRHAGRGGSAGRRDDRGARTRLARHPAARSGGPRPGGGFQPQGRLGLQRAHGTEGGERTLHRGGRRHHRQPPRIAQRGR